MPAVDDGVLIGMMLKDIDKSLPEEEKKAPLLDIIIFILSCIGWVVMAVIVLLAVIGMPPVTEPMTWFVILFAFEIFSYGILTIRYLNRAEKILSLKE